jgi:hypothetical protein
MQHRSNLRPDQREGLRRLRHPRPGHPPRSGRPNRGSHKQVFVCGVGRAQRVRLAGHIF